MPPPTRSTRQSSRTSSPFTLAAPKSPAPTAAGPGASSRQGATTEWVEPPRAAPQPSFMDHHFDRTSIFQDMQPLGAMPSAKLKQKMRENHTRRMMAGDPAAPMAVDEERASTETTPAAEVQRSELREPQPTTTPPKPAASAQKQEKRPQEQTADDAAKPPVRVQRLKITNINGATPPTNSPSRNRHTPSTLQHVQPPPVQMPLPSQPDTPSPLKSPINMSAFTHTWNKESSDAALAAANKRADEIGGKKAMISKLALMEAFRLAENDEKLHAALAAMGAGTGTNEQVRRFRNYIKRSKMRLRKELEKGELRFSSISTAGLSLDNNARLSIPPVSGLPATNAHAQGREEPQTSQRFTLTGDSPATSLQTSSQSQPLYSPQPQVDATSGEPLRPSTPTPAEVLPAVQTPQAQTVPDSVEASSVTHPQQQPQVDPELVRAEIVPTAQASRPQEPGSEEVAPADDMQTPTKQGSELESAGELSDVNETLIRRVENETFMQNSAEVDSSDDRSKKRRRVKELRVAKGQPPPKHRKDAARDKDMKSVEEEQRLDNERSKYREQYLNEDVPNFPQEADYQESFLRTLPTPPVHSPPLVNGQGRASTTRAHRQQHDQSRKNEQPALGDLQLNGARKRGADELDDSASSLTEDLGSTPFNSAPGTPVLAPPSKKQRTVAKTKISPVKPRTRAVAGVSRPGGGRGTPFANNDHDKASDDEHSDFCVACGHAGELLCCDGCDAAYHFECCDPPLTKDSPELEEAWYCPKCRPLPRRSREASPDAQDSIWGDMGKALHPEQRNFQLPKYLQNYFEDNSVGLDGEYVTGQVTYSRASHAKDGIEEHPDYYRLVDKKEKPILCCQCLQGVGFENARRPIIQCDKPNCYAYWHLDCLDPPLANPPTRGWQKGYQKTRVQWVCPRHAEHDYREIQNPAFSSLADQVTSASATGITRHRMRIPRKPELVDFHRGMRTHGRIDIVNRDDDDDLTLRFTEEDTGGKVVRMPEDDVKLNFIAKVKGDRMLMEQQHAMKRRKLSHLDPTFQRRSFNDQRAALSLAQLAERQNELGLSADGVAQLVYALTAQAEGEVDGGDIAPSFDIDPNDRRQREELIKVRRLIDMALANAQSPVRVTRAPVNGFVPSPASAQHLSEAPTRLTPASFPRASSMQPLRTKKHQHNDAADNDAFEIRSEGGLESHLRPDGSFDEREAVSAPGSRPSSRRETRRSSNRKSAFGSK